MHNLPVVCSEANRQSLRANYYRHLVLACGKSVLLAAGCFSVYGVLVGGLSGALSVFILGITVGVFPMCAVALAFLPFVWMGEFPKHPAVFSLAGMLLFTVISVAMMWLIGMEAKGEEDIFWVGRLILFSLLYGAPIGFFLRSSLAKDPQMREHS